MWLIVQGREDRETKRKVVGLCAEDCIQWRTWHIESLWTQSINQLIKFQKFNLYEKIDNEHSSICYKNNNNNNDDNDKNNFKKTTIIIVITMITTVLITIPIPLPLTITIEN